MWYVPVGEYKRWERRGITPRTMIRVIYMSDHVVFFVDDTSASKYGESYHSYGMMGPEKFNREYKQY